MDARDENGRDLLTWALAASGGLLAAVIVALPVSVTPTFEAMFREFGALEELPALTRWVMAPEWAFGGAAAASLLVGAVIVLRRRRLARRAAAIAACASGLVVVGVYLYGIYSPIFAIAEEMGP